MSDADRTTALADALIEAADLRGSVREARLVEIGIGERPGVARTLAARGASVVVTDVESDGGESAVLDATSTTEGDFEFVHDDVTDPDPSIYRDADLLYALRLPPELHGSLAALAQNLGVPAAFTTLGGDPPAVPADPIQLPGTTLYRNAGSIRSGNRSPRADR